MPKLDHQSVVRDGNHFIRLGKDFHQMYQDRWFLIDGIWYEYLESFDHQMVNLAPYQKMSTVPIEDEPDCMPNWYKHEPIIWERILLRLTAIGRCCDQYPQYIYHHVASKYDHVFYHQSANWLEKISYLYAWQCNGGILPAYLKNPIWDENLEELFAYTTRITNYEHQW